MEPNTLYGQNSEMLMFKSDNTCNYRCGLQA
jgi:hypothetical protein